MTYETVRQWGKKFGKAFSDQIRQRAPARGDKWRMDEVVVSIAGEQHWLWRAVDQNGFVLDVLVQRRRDSRAAQQLMSKLLKAAVKPPRVMITDKLRSYGAARAKMGIRVEHRQHKGLNNRAENSHQPTRRRERIMKRFKSAWQAQRAEGGPRARRRSWRRSPQRKTENLIRSSCGLSKRSALSRSASSPLRRSPPTPKS